MKKFLLFVLILTGTLQAFPQKVGLVLSGGGAKGLAHISVIRVLEENNIPIDYVTGTSIGAIIAGLYASGYTSEEMEKLFRSDDFYFWSTGQIQEEYRYFFKRGEENPSWIEVKMEKREDKLKLFPPTNIVPQWQMDFAFMELTATSTAVANGDFDRLFVPFRCVATDVTRNLPVVLSGGDLGEAIRASMTFPFVFKPIEIDGNLLFDGGIVNNFPQDVMMETFNPDIIIGHKVADDQKPASADDILLQVTNMIQRPTNYEIPPEKGILLETKLKEVGIMDFAKIDIAMEGGFNTINPMIDSIKSRIARRSDPVALERRREVFNARKPALLFQNIQVEGVEDALQTKYIINSIKHAKNVFTADMFRREYFKLIADNQIKSIRPLALFNEGTGYFDVHLKVETEKKTEIKVGGNISTKPINQGFVNFDYRLFRNRAYTFSSNLYFGRFYSSFKVGGRIDFPTTRPLYLVSYLTYNRWDYFSSSNELFFENVRPPYIIQNESSFRNEIGVPVGLHDKISTGISWSGSRDEYYQKEKYLKEDIPDKTDFNASVVHLEYENNSLNRTQYATEGVYRNISGRFIAGIEKNIPGTTSIDQNSSSKSHGFFLFRGVSDRFYPVSRKITLGTHLEGVLSDKKNFRNYSSSMLSAPSFAPTPHSKTLFMENFHSNNFMAGGLKGIWHFNPQLHFRLEGYGFVPIHELRPTESLAAERDPSFVNSYYFQGMAALVMDMGVGPLSLSLNYYDKANTKWYFSLNFGFITFNKRGF